MTTFITGGTGLVGSHVAERLRARGEAVRALVRPGSDTRHLEAIGAELAVGDLSDPAGRLASLMQGCGRLVHSGAVVFRRDSRETFRRVNVAGTRAILRAAARAGADRVVHVSSVAVYGGSGPRGGLTEERWRDGEVPEHAVYARSKRDAEELAWEEHSSGAVRVSSVRPGVVYGERDRAFTPILARLARLPLLPLPGGGRATLAVVYAGSVAAAIETLLERPDTVGRAYNLAADGALTGRELMAAFASALGERVRMVSVPAAPLELASRALDRLSAAVPGVPPLRLRRGLRRLTRDNPFDSSRARRELGWGPALPPAEALARTARWWLERERDDLS